MKSRYEGKKIAWVGPFQGEHHYSNFIKRTMEGLGIEVVPIDYRADADKLCRILPSLEVDAVIVNRGEGIPADLIRSLTASTLLWYGEYIWGNDQAAAVRRAEVIGNGAAFDYVVWEGHNEPQVLQLLRNLNCSNVSYVFPVRMDRRIYSKTDVEKTYDVSFIGSATPRRQAFLNFLSDNGVEVNQCTNYNLKEQVEIINRSKINLHINFVEFKTHTQVNMRVMDVLGCGAFCLTEGVEKEEMFTGGEHLVYFEFNNPQDLLNKVNFYLAHDNERERIARQGCEYFHTNYSMEKTVAALLDKIDFSLANKKADIKQYGIGHDKFGAAADKILSFRNACKMMIDRAYPHHWHMAGYKLYELGLYDIAIENFRKSLELCPDRPETLDLLLRTHCQRGDREVASQLFRRLSRIAPDYPGLSELNQLLISERNHNVKNLTVNK